MIGVVLIVLLGLMLTKQNFGLKTVETSKDKRVIGLFLFLLISLFASLFGGSGPLKVYVLTYFFGMTVLDVIATGLVPWLFLLIASLAIFAKEGLIDYQAGFVLMVGMAVGGYIGAHWSIKKGDRWVRRLFFGFVIISSVKLLLGW